MKPRRFASGHEGTKTVAASDAASTILVVQDFAGAAASVTFWAMWNRKPTGGGISQNIRWRPYACSWAPPESEFLWNLLHCRGLRDRGGNMRLAGCAAHVMTATGLSLFGFETIYFRRLDMEMLGNL